jgi:hypothetical protein
VDLDVPDGPVPLQLSNLSDPLDQDRTGKIERGGAHLGFRRGSPARQLWFGSSEATTASR